MEIQFLGQVAVLDESGRVLQKEAQRGKARTNVPSEPKAQAALVLFARRPGRVFTVEQIHEHAWGAAAEGDEDPRNKIQKLVNALRNIFRQAAPGRQCIRTTQDGYVLELEPLDRVDFLEYRKLVEKARQTGGPEDRVSVLDEALALWRGDPPLALKNSISGEALWIELRQMRVEGELLRIEALRGLKTADGIIEPLTDLTTRYPEDERLQLLYVRALSEVGRARDAVRAYEAYEDGLDAMGVTPGDALKAAYREAKGNKGEERPRPFDAQAALRSYLSRVVRSSRRLRVGDATSEPGEGPGQGGMTLDKVWTPLRVALPPTHTDRLDSRTDELGVLEALTLNEHRRVVVLGRPGGGKSSVVAYRTYQLAAAALGRNGAGNLPVHVRLPSLEPRPEVDDIWVGVHEAYEGEAVDGRLVRVLAERLRVGSATLLFDGLDEVQEEQLEGVLAVISLCATAYPMAQIVVTCRTFDYSMEHPRRRLPFPTVELLPFELPQQLEYIAHWYDALALVDTDPHLGQRRGNLQRTLEDTPQLVEMGQTPLLLALMTLVHTQDGELPEARAILYRRTIRHLLAETALWRERSGGSTIASQDMLLLAARVGFEYHRAQETAPVEFRGMTERQLYDITAQHFGLYSTPLGTRARERVAVLVHDHVLRLVQSNGLLLEQGGGTYDFSFKQYREFLAGLYLNTTIDVEDTLVLATRPHWHECFQLLASHEAGGATNITHLLYFVRDLGDQTRNDPPFRQSDAVLAAEMLQEIGREKLVSLNQGRVLSEGTGRGTTGLWGHTAKGLLPLLAESPEPADSSPGLRIRAGLALGRLGDPRIADPDGMAKPVTDRLVAFPAGRTTVGTSSPVLSGRRKLDQASVQPRVVNLSAFRISRFLVTNLEFNEFVDDGGYTDPQWWSTVEAAAWRTGDTNFVAELQQLWRETAEENYGKELQEGYYTREELESTAIDLCRPRSGPYFRTNRRFNAPNQPVVGVNFWEARAYCAWLTDRGRRQGWLRSEDEARLPTEWEWERATSRSGTHGDYPWGDEWDSSRARTRLDETPLNQASPVGCYPSGTWDGGPLDLAGNVWEWTASRLLSYETHHDRHRDDPTGLTDRAIRGSSWYDKDVIEHSRCASRFIDLPGNIYFDLGFRVAVA